MTDIKMKVLILFSGTGSFSKVFKNFKNFEVRTLDIENKFNPYYCEDILTWDYEDILTEWTPDFIHSSPVCKEYSRLKNVKSLTRDLILGGSLILKTIEIINFVKSLNENLKFTIENPKGVMRRLDFMNEFNRITTSYCKYGFDYQKDTDFWYGGFDLVLRPQCLKNSRCKFCKKHNYHRVRVGMSKNSKVFIPSGPKQIGDVEYRKDLIKLFPEIKNEYKNSTYFRYRIPSMLCYDIIRCVSYF